MAAALLASNAFTAGTTAPGAVGYAVFAIGGRLEVVVARTLAEICADAVQTADWTRWKAFVLVLEVAPLASAHVRGCTVAILATIVADRFAFVVAMRFSCPARTTNFNFTQTRTSLWEKKR